MKEIEDDAHVRIWISRADGNGKQSILVVRTSDIDDVAELCTTILSLSHCTVSSLQTVDMKRRPGNGIEGAMVCNSLGSLLRPLFYFLDDVSYPQSLLECQSRLYCDFPSAVRIFLSYYSDMKEDEC